MTTELLCPRKHAVYVNVKRVLQAKQFDFELSIQMTQSTSMNWL